MVKEQVAVKGVLNYHDYQKYGGVFAEVDTLPAEVRLLVRAVGAYYDRFPDKKSITEDELLVFFMSLYPTSRHREYVTQFLRSLKDIRVDNPDVLRDAMGTIVYEHFMARVMALAARGIDTHDRDIPGQIVAEMEGLQALTGKVCGDGQYRRESIPDIIRAEQSFGFRWRLDLLQRALGNPRPGRLHHVFGLTHSGKSAMLIAEATYFARQFHKMGADKTVVYITNEEGQRQLLPRVCASLIGQPIRAIYDFPDRAEAAYSAHGGQRIVVVDDVHHISQVHKIISDTNPTLVFIDQGTKIRVAAGKNDARHEMLQRIYNEFRRLVVRRQIDIIACGQADAASKGKKWLSLQNMDGSKVGLPGELDVAVGIGQDDRDGYERVRYLHVCKNRYTGQLVRGTAQLDEERVRFEEG